MKPESLAKILRRAAAYSLTPEAFGTENPIGALAYAAGNSYAAATDFLWDQEIGWPCWAGTRDEIAMAFCLFAEIALEVPSGVDK